MTSYIQIKQTGWRSPYRTHGRVETDRQIKTVQDRAFNGNRHADDYTLIIISWWRDWSREKVSTHIVTPVHAGIYTTPPEIATHHQSDYSSGQCPSRTPALPCGWSWWEDCPSYWGWLIWYWREIVEWLNTNLLEGGSEVRWTFHCSDLEEQRSCSVHGSITLDYLCDLLYTWGNTILNCRCTI